MEKIEDTRHRNLLLLIEKHGQIGIAQAARIENVSQVSQWATRAKKSDTGKPRNISGPSCRKIEAALGLEDGC